MFETIQVRHRKLYNLAYHNQRMQQSRNDLLGVETEVNLAEAIQIPDWVEEGLYRCRVSYRTEIAKIEFFPYQAKHPGRIALIEAKSVVYPYKYEDRSGFQQLLEQNPDADDVIILHDGNLTDATYANVALFDGTDWLTPQSPLLKGTKRQLLLDSGVLKEAVITVDDLASFRQLALINAMRDLDIVYQYSFHDNHLMIHDNN